VLLSRQPHRCIKGRGWIELVGVDQAAQLLPPAAAELGGQRGSVNGAGNSAKAFGPAVGWIRVLINREI
jgi:hypothetical protein